MIHREQIGLIEPEPLLEPIYLDSLMNEGFGVEVFRTRDEASASFDRRMPDLGLVAVGSGAGKEAAFRWCRELRDRSPLLPIILMAAVDDEQDRISAYRLGADDFITRDRSPEFLAVRIRTLLERVAILQAGANAASDVSQGVFEYGALRLNRERLDVYWGGRPIPLTLTQYWIVLALAESAGTVKSLAALMDAANANVHPNTITANIARIRKQFRVADSNFDAIENIHGHGYRWLQS